VLPQGIWNENKRRGQCSQDKGRAKEKGALLLLLCGCKCEKNISAHAQSVDVTES